MVEGIRGTVTSTAATDGSGYNFAISEMWGRCSTARQGYCVQIDPFPGLFNFYDHGLEHPEVGGFLRFDVERSFPFRAAQRNG